MLVTCLRSLVSCGTEIQIQSAGLGLSVSRHSARLHSQQIEGAEHLAWAISSIEQDCKTFRSSSREYIQETENNEPQENLKIP